MVHSIVEKVLNLGEHLIVIPIIEAAQTTMRTPYQLISQSQPYNAMMIEHKLQNNA